MTKSVGLAVAGLGWIGRKHADLINANSACSLVGLCDSDASHRPVAEEYNVPFYQDLAELLARECPLGVIIATPTAEHSAMAEACAKHSAHVLVEKPIADTLDGANRIIRAASENGIHVLVGHHRRHSPFIQEARSIVKSGALGQLVGVSMLWALMKPENYFEIDWRCRRPGGGPTIINLIHELDSLRFICGEIGRVYAQSSSAVRQLEVEDSLSITLSFKSGALGSILASDTTPSPWSYEASTGDNPHYFHVEENCYHFLGTKSSLAFPRMESWRFADDTQSGWQHAMEKTRNPITRADPLKIQLEHFCRVVNKEEAPVVDGPDGTRSLAVALAVLESIQRESPVSVEL